MKKKILILVPLFLIFVIAMAPASLLENLTAEQKRVSLSGFSGSLWSGEINSVSTNGLSFENVEYSLGLFALLTAKASVDLNIKKGLVKGDFNVTAGSDYMQSLKINDANLRLSAAEIEDYVKLMGAKLKGNISTSSLNLELANNRPKNADGTLRWRNAAVNFAGKEWPLGNFAVDISTNERTKAIVGKIRDNKNQLGIDGEVSLLPNGMVEFSGSISTEIDKSLYTALSMFKNGNAKNGRLPIKFTQKIFR
ncbi:MAG: type II secretion system protein N [Kangiellaceae bacterium]|nr:type II secretion system protein N [Kangiellaceae bacterium]MCW8999189.1 type II secretion system protein N [Kangiellaceae bacterium]